MNKSLLHIIRIAFSSAILYLVTISASSIAQEGDVILSKVKEIEHDLDARVGIALFNTENDQQWLYRSNERFPFTSTFKALACAAVLKQVDDNKEVLDRIIPIQESDLVTYSPVTENHINKNDMTIGDLCDAMTSMSDNTAANLILNVLDGPSGLTNFLRSIGDPISRLDRYETELNEATPGDERDTTTPYAIAVNIKNLILGDVLSPSSRMQLKDWLVNNKVGDDLIRAGVPSDWVVADRTGAGGYGSRGIIATIWPPNRAPLVVAIFITETEASFDERNNAIAEIAKTIADYFEN